MAANHEGNCWVCHHITAKLPEKRSEEQEGLVRRVGIRLYSTGGGRSMMEGPTPSLEPLQRYWVMIQSPCPYIYLELVLHTDWRPEHLPEGYRPDNEGYLKVRTHDIFEIIRVTFVMSTILDLPVPERFDQLVNLIPEGRTAANRAIASVKKRTVYSVVD